jgi:hypothetical protein
MEQDPFNELMHAAIDGELRHVEFKSPGEWSGAEPNLKFKTMRAILGMANLRGPGYIVIGVDESSSSSPRVIGLSSTQLSTWNQDYLASVVVNFADPSVEFEVSPQQYMGVDLILIAVKEFNDLPVICKKDSSDILRRGACYVRP